ncbi:Katanin p80 WD40 repeat-containing subunit B1 [Halocaridina rubra]|uniref:Katanin p80 WD40 repeat-containing subunit B1 n=1 Tax=Halocaridina rubra TaxID=373956 RepID=A0AAN9A663_HALRR
MVPQVMTSPDVIRPEPLRSGPPPATVRSVSPEQPRRGSAAHVVSHLPRPIGTPRETVTPRYEGGNTQPPSPPSQPTSFPSLYERRGSSQEQSACSSPHRDYSHSGNTSPTVNQQYRARAVSESRRDPREPSSASSYAPEPSRYNIRHSPSEPHLVRQSSSPGPPSSSQAYHDSAPSLPQLSRHEAPFGSRSQTSSRPDLTIHKPIDKPTLVRPTPRAFEPQSPDIIYMGAPVKEIDYSFSGMHPEKDTLNFDEFIPNKLSGLNLGGPGALTGIAGTEMSEQEVLSSIMRGHTSMMSVISARSRGLQVTHKLWQTKDLKTAVEHALNTGDQALLVDLLGIINLRPSIWNLDLLTALLPPVSLLLQSKHETYVTCGCNALKLMIKNFAVMIKSNMSGPIHSVGVDISREERFNKCVECYNHMMSIRAFLLKRQTVPGKMGPMYRELVILMQAFD